MPPLPITDPVLSLSLCLSDKLRLCEQCSRDHHEEVSELDCLPWGSFSVVSVFTLDLSFMLFIACSNLSSYIHSFFWTQLDVLVKWNWKRLITFLFTQMLQCSLCALMLYISLYYMLTKAVTKQVFNVVAALPPGNGKVWKLVPSICFQEFVLWLT